VIRLPILCSPAVRPLPHAYFSGNFPAVEPHLHGPSQPPESARARSGLPSGLPSELQSDVGPLSSQPAGSRARAATPSRTSEAVRAAYPGWSESVRVGLSRSVSIRVGPSRSKSAVSYRQGRSESVRASGHPSQGPRAELTGGDVTGKSWGAREPWQQNGPCVHAVRLRAKLILSGRERGGVAAFPRLNFPW
jgi:hypothetical protein